MGDFLLLFPALVGLVRELLVEVGDLDVGLAEVLDGLRDELLLLLLDLYRLLRELGRKVIRFFYNYVMTELGNNLPSVQFF